MMNGKEYIESLKKYKPTIYFMGRKIESVADEPMFRPHIHAAAMTYELAHDPRYEDVMTATSHLTGERTIDSHTSIRALTIWLRR
jgi:4-hydroxybutyryl-CoA dehydratase/vinylacetyl-CoA-Delta-isomerase